MNSKVAVLCFAVAVAVACLEVTSANPLTQDLVGKELNSLHDELAVESDLGELPIHHRQKRFTCDALSFSAGGISAGHAACALHCVSMRNGNKGGYCNSQGVCNCRK